MSAQVERERRDSWLRQTDSELAAQCRTESFRGSGRGGQKRNVTESAVRLTHEPTGLSATSDKTRSQAHNRRDALRQLRMEIALRCRTDPPRHWPWERIPSRRHEDFPRWAADILDLLHGAQYSVGDAARACDTSTGRFVRVLASDKRIWQEVNRQRQVRGLRPLRAP
mgnify:FL=1